MSMGCTTSVNSDHSLPVWISSAQMRGGPRHWVHQQRAGRGRGEGRGGGVRGEGEGGGGRMNRSRVCGRCGSVTF